MIMVQHIERQVLVFCVFLLATDYQQILCNTLYYGPGSLLIDDSFEDVKSTKVRVKRFVLDNGEEISGTPAGHSSSNDNPYDDEDIASAEESSGETFDFAKNLKPVEKTTVPDAANRSFSTPPPTSGFTKEPTTSIDACCGLLRSGSFDEFERCLGNRCLAPNVCDGPEILENCFFDGRYFPVDETVHMDELKCFIVKCTGSTTREPPSTQVEDFGTGCCTRANQMYRNGTQVGSETCQNGNWTVEELTTPTTSTIPASPLTEKTELLSELLTTVLPEAGTTFLQSTDMTSETLPRTTSTIPSLDQRAPTETKMLWQTTSEAIPIRTETSSIVTEKIPSFTQEQTYRPIASTPRDVKSALEDVTSILEDVTTRKYVISTAGDITSPRVITPSPGAVTRPAVTTTPEALKTPRVVTTSRDIQRPGVSTTPGVITATPDAFTALGAITKAGVVKTAGIITTPGVITAPEFLTTPEVITTKPEVITTPGVIAATPEIIPRTSGVITTPVVIIASPGVITTLEDVTRAGVITAPSAPEHTTSKPIDTTSIPRNDTSTLRDVMSTPRYITTPKHKTPSPGIITTPADITSAPKDITATSTNMTSAPEDVTSTPKDGASTPEDVTSRSEDVTSTPENVSSTAGNVTTEPEVITTHEDIISTPENVTAHTVITLAPENITTAPEDVTSIPEGAISAPEKVISTSRDLRTASMVFTTKSDPSASPESTQQLKASTEVATDTSEGAVSTAATATLSTKDISSTMIPSTPETSTVVSMKSTEWLTGPSPMPTDAEVAEPQPTQGFDAIEDTTPTEKGTITLESTVPRETATSPAIIATKAKYEMATDSLLSIPTEETILTGESALLSESKIRPESTEDLANTESTTEEGRAVTAAPKPFPTMMSEMPATTEQTTTPPSDEYTCRWDNMTVNAGGTILRDPTRCLHVECWYTVFGAFIDVTVVHEARGCCELHGKQLVPPGYVTATRRGGKKRCIFGRWHTHYFDSAINMTANKELPLKSKKYQFFPRLTPIDEALEICENINGTLAVPDNREQEMELGELGAEAFGGQTTFYINQEKIQRHVMNGNDEENPEKYIVYPHDSRKMMHINVNKPGTAYAVESFVENIQRMSVPICEQGGRNESFPEYFSNLVSIGTLSDQGLPKEAAYRGMEHGKDSKTIARMHEWRLPTVPRRLRAGHTNIGRELRRWGQVHKKLAHAIKNKQTFKDPLPVYKANHFNVK